MIGLQQISIIATPPARRQPVRTSVLEADDNHIRTALQREHARGGQSFIVVPRIEDLAPVRDRIRRLAPDLSVLEAHGKLPAADVDAAMVRFGDGEGDVLLATNIIEAGLDVPRANTMIIWRADRFGLAQLHQLRGRVGRGSRRGQVLLMTDGEGLAERTLKRLRTLTTYDQLGAGFEISISDLDRRGAGDPLSDTQAGHMKLIGVDLYQHLFAAVLRHMADGSDTTWTPDIRVGAVGQLPPDWIPDADLRLGLYIRLGHAPNLSALDMLRDELEDRFGALPDDAETLLTATRAALLARKARIARVDAGPAAIALTPREPREPPAGIGLEVKDDRWLLRERTSDEDRGDRVADLLERLLDEKR
jgi:transcription-repair coupling factor (superfamily II helicase)